MQAAIAMSFGESDRPTNIDHGCDLILLDIDRSQREIDVVFARLDSETKHQVSAC